MYVINIARKTSPYRHVAASKRSIGIALSSQHLAKARYNVAASINAYSVAAADMAAANEESAAAVA